MSTLCYAQAVKKSTHYRLSEEALIAIDRIARATGLTATAVIETTVREAAMRQAVALVGTRPPTEKEIARGLELEPLARECLESAEDEEQNSLSHKESAKRKTKRTNVAEGKADQQKLIKKALAKRTAAAPSRSTQTYGQSAPHTQHSGVLPYPGCAACAALAKGK